MLNTQATWLKCNPEGLTALWARMEAIVKAAGFTPVHYPPAAASLDVGLVAFRLWALVVRWALPTLPWSEVHAVAAGEFGIAVPHPPPAPPVMRGGPWSGHPNLSLVPFAALCTESRGIQKVALLPWDLEQRLRAGTPRQLLPILVPEDAEGSVVAARRVTDTLMERLHERLQLAQDQLGDEQHGELSLVLKNTKENLTAALRVYP